MKGILIGLDHNAEEVRSRRRPLKRGTFHTLMILRGGMAIQVRDVIAKLEDKLRILKKG
jgi:hypothetical protein